MMKMEESTKCPICGKEGIHDFRQEDVVCPCCGSDLSIYRNINNLLTVDDNVPRTGKKQNIVIGLLSFTTLLFAIGCAFLYIQKQPAKEPIPAEKGITQVNQRVSELTDSIERLNSEIELLKKEKLTPKQNQSNRYVVKKGDSFCKISRKELGVEKRYTEILSLNHLQTNSILHIGDTLKMPEK